MLLTNSQMDKLAAARQEFRKLGMMDGTTAGYTAMILGGGSLSLETWLQNPMMTRMTTTALRYWVLQ